VPPPAQAVDGKVTIQARLTRIFKHPKTKRILSPPTLGCILGALAGSIPFFRALIVDANAPFLPLFEGLKTLGTAYLPTVLLVLAGSLAQGISTFDFGE